MMCADGDAHDKVFPDYSSFTCKPGPGKFVKCIYLCKYIAGVVIFVCHFKWVSQTRLLS